MHRLITTPPVPGPGVKVAIHKALEEALVTTKGKECDWFLPVGAATPLAAGVARQTAKLTEWLMKESPID